MVEQSTVPPWAVPARHAIDDTRIAARLAQAHEVGMALDLAGTFERADEAIAAAGTVGARAADTLAWLAGVVRTPPLPIPLRTADGRIPTVDERYQQLLDDVTAKRGAPLSMPEDLQRLRRQALREVQDAQRRAAALDSVTQPR